MNRKFYFTVLFLGATLTLKGQTFTQLKSFGLLSNAFGTTPRSQLVLGPDGMLYGTLTEGGGILQGTVFKMRTNGADFTVLKQFTNRLDGANPKSGLLLEGDILYGTTSTGGAEGGGTVFKLKTDGSDFAVLHSLATGSYDRNLPQNGAQFTMEDANPPMGGLALVGNTLFGTTRSGGAPGRGTVYRLNKDGSDFRVIKEFNGPDGAAPTCDPLILDGMLFGTTSFGGSSNLGTVFRLGVNGDDFAVLKEFSGVDGARPYPGLTVSDGALFGVTRLGGSSRQFAGTLFRINPDGTGFVVLKSFSGVGQPAHGCGPTGRLTARAGVLYGTAGTFVPQTDYLGTVFKINTDGSGFTVVVGRDNFIDPPFQSPAGLVLEGNAAYGITAALAWGPPWTVFKVDLTTRVKTVLRTFVSGGGEVSSPRSILLKEGILYGASGSGGSSNGGTVFKIDADGSNLKILKSFNERSDGSRPENLTFVGETLYGVAVLGGAWGQGTAFKLGTNGSGFRVTRAFNFPDGIQPTSGLVEVGGLLYGVTWGEGPTGSVGTLYRMNTNGGGFTVLHGFSTSEGIYPSALTAFGGVLYGATSFRGANDRGTIFRVNTNGSGFTVLHHFQPEEASRISYATSLVPLGDAIYGLAGTNLFKVATNGSGLTILAHFNDYSGGLMTDGTTLYGVAGPSVFRINPDGTGLHILKRFTDPLEGRPNSGFVLSDESLYGLTFGGGPLDQGTLFRIDLRPSLTITRDATQVTLSWPAYAESYALEQSAALASDSWSTVAGSPIVDGNLRRWTVPAAPSVGSFFRLRRE